MERNNRLIITKVINGITSASRRLIIASKIEIRPNCVASVEIASICKQPATINYIFDSRKIRVHNGIETTLMRTDSERNRHLVLINELTRCTSMKIVANMNRSSIM